MANTSTSVVPSIVASAADGLDKLKDTVSNMSAVSWMGLGAAAVASYCAFEHLRFQRWRRCKDGSKLPGEMCGRGSARDEVRPVHTTQSTQPIYILPSRFHTRRLLMRPDVLYPTLHVPIIPCPPPPAGPDRVTPVLGGIVEMVKDPYGFWERQLQYAPSGMSWNSLVGTFTVFVTDPAVCRHVFNNNSKDTLLMALHPSAANVLGKKNIAFLHGPDHKALRKSFIALFTRRALSVGGAPLCVSMLMYSVGQFEMSCSRAHMSGLAGTVCLRRSQVVKCGWCQPSQRHLTTLNHESICVCVCVSCGGQVYIARQDQVICEHLRRWLAEQGAEVTGTRAGLPTEMRVLIRDMNAWTSQEVFAGERAGRMAERGTWSLCCSSGADAGVPLQHTRADRRAKLNSTQLGTSRLCVLSLLNPLLPCPSPFGLLPSSPPILTPFTLLLVSSSHTPPQPQSLTGLFATLIFVFPFFSPPSTSTLLPLRPLPE